MPTDTFGVPGDVARFAGGIHAHGPSEIKTSLRMNSPLFGAGLTFQSVEVETPVMTGATVTLTGIIPAGAVVLGVLARVTAVVTGAASSNIGDGTTASKWAAAVPLTLGFATTNLTGTAPAPTYYAAATNVVLTAVTANYTAGKMRVVVYFYSFDALDG